ncbi:unnamed protein product [Discula destructiva]
MHSITVIGLLSTFLLPMSALACANYRAEFTKDGDPNEPSISKIRVEFQDDCGIFCGTDGKYIESSSDNEWEVPCRTNEIILVVKDRGNTVEYRRQGQNGGTGSEGDLNFSFSTYSVTAAPNGGKYFAHNPYCPPPVNGFLVPGKPIAWPGSWVVTGACQA